MVDFKQANAGWANYFSFKVRLSLCKNVCFLCFNESIVEKGIVFHLKNSFCHHIFGHVGKQLEKKAKVISSKFTTSQTWK